MAALDIKLDQLAIWGEHMEEYTDNSEQQLVSWGFQERD